jgi:hypothetical protein
MFTLTSKKFGRYFALYVCTRVMSQARYSNESAEAGIEIAEKNK